MTNGIQEKTSMMNAKHELLTQSTRDKKLIQENIRDMKTSILKT